MFADFVVFLFFGIVVTNSSKLSFAVIPNLMTNQSYAQVTVAYKRVESPILQI